MNLLSLAIIYLLGVRLQQTVCRTRAYEIVEEFSGATFFDKWDFYGNLDNLTSGDVWWLDRAQAEEQGLVSINSRGNAVIRVDNSSEVAFNEKRNSVRITTQGTYDFGSLWIIDVARMPWGCSVWTSFGTTGADGSISIIEGINHQAQNQMALHTRPGCIHTTPLDNQLGASGEANCSAPSGCVVWDTKRFSYGRDFGGSGGGVFGAQFERGGIFIWYWPRGMIPQSIYNAGPNSPMHLDDWGLPSAGYPTTDTCNIADFFSPQKLLLSINLCGAWAGLPELYQFYCANDGPTGTCYADMVVGPGAHYSDAYWEIPYIRTYTTREGMPPPSTATVTSATSGGAQPTAGQIDESAQGSSALPGNGGSFVRVPLWIVLAGTLASFHGIVGFWNPFILLSKLPGFVWP